MGGKNYFDIPVWDGHCHTLMSRTAEETAESFRRIMKYHNYERITLCAIINETVGDHPSDNAVGLYLKDVLNREKPNSVYVYGNIRHHYDARDTAEGYLSQVKQLMAMGADGIKILDGKTGDRKRLGRRLDDPIFDEMYQYIEEKGLTVTMHVGDPRDNWDITKVSEYARKKGWFYDETYPTLDELYGEVDGILTKFPKLRLNLAHFFFMGDNYDKAVAFMEKWENASFDLTPGGEMFVHFTAEPDKWRAFFEKYRDRLTYGTDTYNTLCDPDTDEYAFCPTAGVRINQLRRMLEGTEPFEDKQFGRLVPLALDKETVSKICYENVLKNNGDARPVCGDAVREYAKEMLRDVESGDITAGSPEKDVHEASLLKTVIDYFKA